ncbi:hypothetical protein BDW02DRAFT_638297 [Decorospora gaudefroyi]|uniref:Uncharacterized protein n=1 Tax=Decorospora gaudefroyi TaxID=184978 RepID=A0A6A5KK33_9PLEO|nr:hypothetical protein BDW02DRAFT_638297 [Decorospora gaudefroyi]
MVWDDVDVEEKDVDQAFSWEKSVTAATSAEDNGKYEALEANLEDTKAWLDKLCQEEEAKTTSRSDGGYGDFDSQAQVIKKLISQQKEPGMDTSVLERIRRGEGIRDKIYEDLLAPLRLQMQPVETEESYKDMESVLLAWNQHVASNSGDNVGARQAFIAALRNRIKAVDKVLAISSDEKNIDQFDRVGQIGILEPSERQLLKAIHAYRPEMRDFKDQDPFNMLIVMWVHIHKANPDITGDDDWMYLMYKVLNGETELERRFEREAERRKFQVRKETAIREGDLDGVAHFTRRWRVYNDRLAEIARQGIIAKFRCARQQLGNKVLDELLELTVLQSAQQWAGRDTRPGDWSPPWTELLDKYAEADARMDEKFESHFPDVEATFEVSAGQIEEMTTIHDMVLTRTLKFAGVDLVGMDESEKDSLIEARLNDPVTATMMEQTLNGVLESKRVAQQILRHVGGMEESLHELSGAAKTKYQELEKLCLLANRDMSLSIRGRLAIDH